MKTKAKPFVKWAGGKGQIAEQLISLLPADILNKKIYIEPFVGGGALFFEIMHRYTFDYAVIIDINKELINCYRCIQSKTEDLISALCILENHYLSLSGEERTDYFYEVRNKYNSIKLNGEFDVEKAADFIFLNHTCFNGLYRVNRGGEFNVPHGKYKNPTICDKENLRLISKTLHKTKIFFGDYSLCENYLSDEALIYFDPPYRPLNEIASFVGYDKGGFSDSDQVKLSEFYKKADNAGAVLMLSNSDPKNTNPDDDFFDKLYKGYRIDRVFAKRMINCQAEKRGNITEIVVRNY